MKRAFLPLLLAATILYGCSSESSLPTPTGEGVIRSFNAVPGSPEITFLIEECPARPVRQCRGGMAYRSAVALGEWDDFAYNFNFEIRLPGETENRRVATEFLDIVADRDYTLVLTGDAEAPDVTVWEADVRAWSDTETVFDARFGHTSATLGPVDVYLNAPGIAPAVGEQIGTLNFGEVLPPADYEAGDYVITVTAAGDPATVHYQSDTLALVAQVQVTYTIVDGDETTTAPHVLVALPANGGAVAFVDDRFPATIRFLHGVIDAGAVDIYDDEMLTNAIVTGLEFGAVSDRIERPAESTYRFTPAGDTGAVLLERTSNLIQGTRANFVLLNSDDGLASVAYLPSLQSRTTAGRIQMFAAALNHDPIDLFVLEPGSEPTSEGTGLIAALRVSYGQVTAALDLVPDAYDLYLTTPGEPDTVLAGPVSIDLALGDVLQAIALDVVDPALAEIVFYPDP